MELAERLRAHLSDVDRPAEFAVAGLYQTPMPDIEVDGVGPLAFPLLAVQAEQLAGVAAAAPYGRGPDTIVDETVRKTWQIAPSNLRIRSEPWETTIAAIVSEAGRRLGVDDAQAELYKLLLYEEGGFFAEHRDSEKVDGMFATLVVTLPSRWTGGELVVRHAGAEVELDLQTGSVSNVAWGAFFTDCSHQLRPVTSGHRLCLVYNLVRPGGEFRAPDHSAVADEVAAALREWDSDFPKLLYVLDHSYTPAELDFSRLKGRDAGVAAVVRAAAAEADCALHLAMVSIEESGVAEEVYQRYSRYSRYSDPEFVAGEVSVRTQAVEHWRTLDGSDAPFERMPFEMGELCPPGALADEQPDQEHFWEATGNEGASFERTYRRAALVLWPRSQTARQIASCGPNGSLPFLESAEPGEPAKQLARAIVSSWPDRSERAYGPTAELGKRLLDALIRLEDGAAISLFLDVAVKQRGVRNEEAEALAWASVYLEERRFKEVAEFLAKQASRELEPPARFLASVAVLPSRRDLAELVADRVVDAMPTEVRVDWRATVTPAALRFLFEAIIALELPALAAAAAMQIEGRPHSYDLDTLVVPALSGLCRARNPDVVRTSLEALWNMAVSHLGERARRPLGDPDDWSLDVEIRCHCENCRKLQAFVRSPTERELRIPLAKEKRRHLHNVASGKDLSTSTIRSGRPFTWVCQKNATGYQRRREQRERDLIALTELGAELNPS